MLIELVRCLAKLFMIYTSEIIRCQLSSNYRPMYRKGKNSSQKCRD